MIERQAQYCTRIHDYSNTPCPDCGTIQRNTPTDFVVDTDCAAVTITVSREWADFLTRAQTARREWRSHHAVSHIAIVDWRNLGLRCVTLDDGGHDKG